MAKITKQKNDKGEVQFVPTVWSVRYQCFLTKSLSYFDEASQDWLSEQIESVIREEKINNLK